MHRLVSACLAAAMAVSTIAFGPVRAYADDTAPCATVNLVFARGSGQGLNDKEAKRFFKTIGDDRIDASVSVNKYEVGTASQGGAQYPAVGIGTDSVQGFKNMIEADAGWTSVLGGKYRDSVSKGVTETVAYLTARTARCPGEQIVIGGYSQGAQVVGDALAGVDRAVRDKIAYVALFGDPKLYLPEGRGVFPSACHGGSLSPWRRGNVGCFTDNGILEARVPYMPTDIEDRVGSWCDREDPICDNNPADAIGSTHGNYANEGNGIDEAALEAAEALKGRLPAHAGDFDTSIIVIGVGTTGLDVAFVLDTTGSMSPSIDAARESARRLATAITALRGRVALTEYRDAGDAFVAAVRSPLSADISHFENALDPLVAGGGGDTPEALLTALMTTFNGLDWRPGATKAVVVLTDADYHDPDVANGYTLDQVAQRALEIDPVNVYPVVPEFLTSFYGPLATQTSGKVVPDSGDTQSALLNAITQIQNRPTALLAIDEFWAAPGTPITLDASRSYDPDSTISSYGWDFDGDGTVDQSTTTPVVSHTYSSPFDGPAQVRIRSADGGVANAIATMHINATGLAGKVPAAPSHVTATAKPHAAGRTVTMSWTPGSGGGTVGAWRLYHEGRLVGAVDGTKHTVSVDGVPDGVTSLSLAAVNGFGTSALVEVAVPVVGSPSATATAAASASPADASPSTAPGTPTPDASDQPSELGRTGVDLAAIIGIGGILIAVGVVLLLILKRRRSRWAAAE